MNPGDLTDRWVQTGESAVRMIFMHDNRRKERRVSK